MQESKLVIKIFERLRCYHLCQDQKATESESYLPVSTQKLLFCQIQNYTTSTNLEVRTSSAVRTVLLVTGSGTTGSLSQSTTAWQMPCNLPPFPFDSLSNYSFEKYCSLPQNTFANLRVFSGRLNNLCRGQRGLQFGLSGKGSQFMEMHL